MKRSLVVVAASLAVFARAPTPAGVPLVDDQGAAETWDLADEQPDVIGGKVTFFPDPSSLRDSVQGQKTPLQAVRDGVHEWEVATTAIRFQEDASRPAAGPNGLDRVNYVGWVQKGLDRTALAVTTVTRVGDRLADMDVTLNDRDFAWDTFTPGQPGIADIQSIVTHEWGHALGCDHVPLRTSTMYAVAQTGAISLRSLSSDDRALVGTLYPNALFQSTTGAIEGVVDLAGATDERAIHVVAVSTSTGEPAASTLTRPDGGYRIDGLPAGAYRIVAAPCLPLKGSMSQYWTSGSTRFLPSALRTTPENPAPLLPLAVAAGRSVAAPSMSVADAASPFEPNDSATQATPIAVGDAVCARFETSGDLDWYAFDGTAGSKLAVNVLSWGLGAAADPTLAVFAPGGAPLVQQDDARSPQTYADQIEGADFDVRVLALELPQSGTYRLRLGDQTSGAGPDAFYVLMVTATSDAPSAALTTVAADPSRLPADGSSTATILVRPRKESGDDVGPVATVSLTHDGAGAVGAVIDSGDGTYVAEVTAPTDAGDDRFVAEVTTAEGVATLSEAAKLVYLGPADGAASTFAVAPRRIDVAPASPDAGLELHASVALLPRDARGEPLGPGRDVTFSLTAPSGAALAGVVDSGDGRYADEASAAAQPGVGQVSANVDGVALSPVARIAFGFGLVDVLTDVQADAQAYAATPGIRSRAAKSFEKAQSVAAAAVAASAAGGRNATSRAVSAARAVLGKFVAGRAEAHVGLGAPAPEHDLARSVREAAAASLATAVAATPRAMRTVAAAQSSIADGDAAFASGQWAKAARLWRSAFRRAQPLQPR